MAIKLGAEPKKVALLAGLLILAAVLFYVNVFSGPDGDSGSAALAPAVRPATPVAGAVPASGSPATATPPRPARPARSEFRPSLRRRPEEAIDLSLVDPTLRVDLMERLQAVTAGGSGRNLFEFAAAPPPPAPPPSQATIEPKIIPLPVADAATPSEPAVAAPPPKPTAPPIPLKFFGYSTPPRGGTRRGFFLDGEEIVVAIEGELIKRRYKVIRIGPASVEMEDMQFNQRQTLRLEEGPGGVG